MVSYICVCIDVYDTQVNHGLLSIFSLFLCSVFCCEIHIFLFTNYIQTSLYQNVMWYNLKQKKKGGIRDKNTSLQSHPLLIHLFQLPCSNSVIYIVHTWFVLPSECLNSKRDAISLLPGCHHVNS